MESVQPQQANAPYSAVTLIGIGKKSFLALHQILPYIKIISAPTDLGKNGPFTSIGLIAFPLLIVLSRFFIKERKIARP